MSQKWKKRGRRRVTRIAVIRLLEEAAGVFPFSRNSSHFRRTLASIAQRLRCTADSIAYALLNPVLLIVARPSWRVRFVLCEETRAR